MVADDFMDLNPEEKKYITFSFHEVWQEEKNLNADISLIVGKFREMGFYVGFIGENTTSIKNSCYADKLNSATINYNGEVFKCTARNFDSESKEGMLGEDGIIAWNEKHQKRVFDTRFQNKPCLECRILPICNGGCSQQRNEHIGKDYCVFDFDEDKKLNVVKEKFYSRMAHSLTEKVQERSDYVVQE